MFDIEQSCLRFSPIQPDHLISCGKQSIKVMLLRDTGHIRCTSVVLAKIGRDLLFLDVCYSGDYIYASVLDGRVMQITYEGKVNKVIKT